MFRRDGNASETSLESSFSSSSSSRPPSPPPSRSVTGPARPIRLVYADENGRFRMDPEAVAVLQLVKEPIDVLTRFVFDRTRPKQVGATTMTGPILVGVLQSYLDALNNGEVPTIFSSWQSVEEAECQRAFDSAIDAYRSAFDRSKLPEEAALREAHEEAVQKALAAFNDCAVGVGPTREKYEGNLHRQLKKEFEDYKKKAYMEAELQCVNAIQNMEGSLRRACHASDANIDNVLKVLGDLISEYEKTSQGPLKWQQLASFLNKSLEGPVLDLIRMQIHKVESENGSLRLRCRAMEGELGLLKKEVEASKQSKTLYLKRYEDALNDQNKLREKYRVRINNLQGNSTTLQDKCASLQKSLDSAKQEAHGGVLVIMALILFYFWGWFK